MFGFDSKRVRLAALVTALTIMAGGNPALLVPTAEANAGQGAKPAPPVAMQVPPTSIITGSGDLGYLPGSGEVGADGQYSYSISLEVPDGRAGMQPRLALSYGSESGNGVLGVGWSLSGVSMITRCAETFSTEGQVEAAHHTLPTPFGQASDRFCLDGRKLMAINGIYGQVGSEYRTEEDSFAKIVATQDPQNTSANYSTLLFTVQTPNGHTLIYKGLYGAAKYQYSLSGTNGTNLLNAGVRVPDYWAMVSDTDPGGNGIQYIYAPVKVQSPASWAAGYGIATVTQNLLQSIVYTIGNDSKGADTPDPGRRSVALVYEDLPKGTASEFGFQDGVGNILGKRLKTVTMSAPNPAASIPVWQYDITYTKSSFSNRSLLNSVKRCALDTAKDPNGRVEAGCTWTKTFAWSSNQYATSPILPQPQWSGIWKTVAGPLAVGGLNIINGQYQNSSPLNPSYFAGLNFDANVNRDIFMFYFWGTFFSKNWPDNPPVVRVMDMDGDGRDDVLFQAGGGGGPSVMALTSGSGPLATVASNLGALSNINDAGSGGNRQALQRSYPVDIDGDGVQELYVTQSSLANGRVRCQNKLLHWTGAAAGFADIGLNLPQYDCTNPYLSKYTDLFLDVDGDGRLDHLQAGVWDFGGAISLSDNTSKDLSMLSSVVPDYWSTGQISQGGAFGPKGQIPQGPADAFGNANAAHSACHVYAVDFTGDGRAQLFGQNGDAFAQLKTMGSGPGGGSGSLSGQDLGGQIDDVGDGGGQNQYLIGSIYGDPLVECSGGMLVSWAPNTNSSTNGQWLQQAESAPASPIFPAIPGNALNGADPLAEEHQSRDATETPKLIFGDFNGDGLIDVIEPAYVANGTNNNWSGAILALRWNTGNGFGPEIPLSNTPWYDGTPDVGVYAVDINHDGRTDLVIFHRNSTPSITLMLSNGDGTFSSSNVSEQSGLTDPGLQSCTINNSVSFGTSSCTMSGGIGDFDGDGYADLFRLEPTGPLLPNQQAVQANLQIMQQVPVIADRIVSVTDEGTLWPREQVTYSLHSSDKPEAAMPCTYPQRCVRRGFPVVRTVTNWDADANATSPFEQLHTVYYSYEDPVADARGRGGLGFRKVRVWDPTRIQQKITLYDNRTQVAGKYYAGVGHPKSVTTVTALPPTGSQTLPTLPRAGSSSVNSRVVQIVYNETLVQTNGNQTYLIEPSLGSLQPASVTSEWEQAVSLTSDVKFSANSDYIWGVQPMAPLLQHTTVVTGIDAYGNILSQNEQASIDGVAGKLTQNNAVFNNLTAAPRWLIGQLASRDTTVTEADDPQGLQKVSERMEYGYYASGLLHTVQQDQEQWIDNGLQSWPVSTTTLGRDGYGNLTSIATTAAGPDGTPTTRQVNIEYDPWWPGQPNERIFASQHWLPVSLNSSAGSWMPSAWTAIHPAFGVTVATMNALGVQSNAIYDDQGRLRQTTPAVGVPTKISYAARPDIQGGVNGLIVATATGGQVSRVYSDAAGRKLQSTHLAFDGEVTTDSYIQYDALGRAISRYRPYTGTSVPAALPAGTTYAATDTYDGLNRILKTVGPDGQPTIYAYRFFAGTDTYPAFAGQPSLGMPPATAFSRKVSTTTTTDPIGNQRRVDTDMDARVMTTASYLSSGSGSPGWLTTYQHYAPNGPDRVTLPSGAIEITTYDSLGRVSGHYSPDMGTTVNLSYDGFGEQLSSTHTESGSKTIKSYDALGRVSGWSTCDPGTIVPSPVAPCSGLTTSAAITYDTQPNGLGKLANATSSDNVSITPAYDVYGRISTITETVNGQSYTSGVQYNDPEGRVSALTYPAIGINPVPGLTLQHSYNAYEYLSGLSDQTSNPTTSGYGSQSLMGPIWVVMSRNVDGSMAQASLSSGFGSPSLGSLNYTYLPQTGQLREMKYTAYFTAGGAAANSNLLDLEYGYYANGLVQVRVETGVNSDSTLIGRLEHFDYDSMNRLTQWDMTNCGGQCGGQLPEPFRQYAYSVDGNLQTVLRNSNYPQAAGWAAQQSNVYGSNNNASGGPHALTSQQLGTAGASSVTYDTQGRQTGNAGANRTLTYNAFDLPRTVTQGNHTWTLQYDAFGNRASKTLIGPMGNTTVYIGSSFERRIPASGTVTDIFKIPGVGQVDIDETSGQTRTLFTLSDPLGSTGLVLQASGGINSSTESVSNTYFYEPFGARIGSDGSAYSAPVGEVHDGFTGQEEDDDFGLINFKGRMYDPGLKRFLSPDPDISHVGFGQSYNPYSYVLNSPLNLVDPTGFDDDQSPQGRGYIKFGCSGAGCQSENGKSYCDGGGCRANDSGPVAGGLKVKLAGGATSGADGISTATYGKGTGGSMGSMEQSGASDQNGVGVGPTEKCPGDCHFSNDDYVHGPGLWPESPWSPSYGLGGTRQYRSREEFNIENYGNPEGTGTPAWQAHQNREAVGAIFGFVFAEKILPAMLAKIFKGTPFRPAAGVVGNQAESGTFNVVNNDFIPDPIGRDIFTDGIDAKVELHRAELSLPTTSPESPATGLETAINLISRRAGTRIRPGPTAMETQMLSNSIRIYATGLGKCVEETSEPGRWGYNVDNVFYGIEKGKVRAYSLAEDVTKPGVQ